MAGLSFSTMGATPSVQTTTPSYIPKTQNAPTPQITPTGGFFGGSPASNALNSAQNTPPPTTPVKKTTVNNVDGSSTSTEYHAPVTPTNTTATQPTTSGILSQPTEASYNPNNGGVTNVGGVNYQNGAPITGYVSGGQSAAPSTTTASGGTTFPGIINSLATTAQNGSTVGQNATNATLNYGAGNIPIGTDAANIASQYGQQIANVGAHGAQFEGGQLTTGTSPVAQGNAAVTAQTTAAEQTALAQGEQGALQGTAQQLTAQQQAADAAELAAGQANTAQANTQSGLTNAGTLSAPTSNFPFKFDPLTGSFTNAAGASAGSLTYNPTTDAATLAKEVINNQIPYSDAVTAMGYAPNGVGTGALQQAIVQAGGNIAALEGQASGISAAAAAPGQAAATNIGTSGTAQTGAYNTIYSNATQAAATYSQQQSAINSIGNQALQLMANTPGINPNSSQFLNTKLNQVGTQLSSPQYAAFNTAIQSLQARIGSALQAGEIPTAATSNAESIANGSLTIGALASTLKQVDAEMSSFVGTQQSLADYAKSQMQTGSTGNTPSNSSYTEGSTVSSGGYNFVYQNGKWVAK